MRAEYFLFVHNTTSILAKLSTWCFEHSGDISCSLLVNLSHTDESQFPASQLYTFCFPKINKNRNNKVCSTKPFTSKPLNTKISAYIPFLFTLLNNNLVWCQHLVIKPLFNKFFDRGILWCKTFLLGIICSNFLPFYF